MIACTCPKAHRGRACLVHGDDALVLTQARYMLCRSFARVAEGYPGLHWTAWVEDGIVHVRVRAGAHSHWVMLSLDEIELTWSGYYVSDRLRNMCEIVSLAALFDSGVGS